MKRLFLTGILVLAILLILVLPLFVNSQVEDCSGLTPIDSCVNLDSGQCTSYCSTDWQVACMGAVPLCTDTGDECDPACPAEFSDYLQMAIGAVVIVGICLFAIRRR